MGKEVEAKKLTQMQKTYLVKRVNEIANKKIKGIGGTANYGAPARYTYYSGGVSRSSYFAEDKIDRDVAIAIADGKVELKSKEDTRRAILSALAGVKDRTFFNISNLAFIDLKSLAAFNKARNDKAKAEYEDKCARETSVRKEADILKDSIMLEGSLASQLLEEFEKKEF